MTLFLQLMRERETYRLTGILDISIITVSGPYTKRDSNEKLMALVKTGNFNSEFLHDVKGFLFF